jgi:hypothetical protein
MTVALAAKTRRGKNSPLQKHFHKNFQKNKYKGNFQGKGFNMSRIKCFTCNKMGHYAKDCRSKKKGFCKGKHHGSTVEGGSGKKASESPKRQENIKEYYLVYALPGHITPDRDTWLIDSGVFKTYDWLQNILSDFQKKTCSVQIQHGDKS